MLLSVRLMTYNHSDCIIDALKGINKQRTHFPFEVVVGDDFSSDGTLVKIKAFRFNNPNLHVRVLQRRRGDVYDIKRQQLGRLYNFTDIIQHCTGRYIALLDGDDYWTDPLKLQKQVDFLESHNHINLCFSNIGMKVGDEVRLHSIKIDFMERGFSYSKLLEYNNFIATASVLFRRPTNLEFPDWFYSLPYGDMGLYKLLANGDSFYGLRDVMAVYRVHDQGMYSGLGRLQSRKIYYQFYRSIFPFLNKNEKEVSILKMKALRKEIAILKFRRNLFLGKVYSVGLKFGLVE
ncbi:glycosyltransferase family 2 protein [Mangrovimonas aestuarii]|uniref:glycosyltransferase family 2 protein n=1 Tax=Mangrovimonas aestuarii TaxID=3018443 RepID=UPI002378F34C|nr:glycosyltransferase [Mangrovimonas aestuarii]